MPSCYAVGAEKALIYAAFRTHKRRGQGKIPFPLKSAFYCVTNLYTQLFNLLCDKADDVYGGRLPVHVRCLLDEFANIGQIPKFEKLIATIRSREISASIILQSQSQLMSTISSGHLSTRDRDRERDRDRKRERARVRYGTTRPRRLWPV